MNIESSYPVITFLRTDNGSSKTQCGLPSLFFSKRSLFKHFWLLLLLYGFACPNVLAWWPFKHKAQQIGSNYQSDIVQPGNNAVVSIPPSPLSLPPVPHYVPYSPTQTSYGPNKFNGYRPTSITQATNVPSAQGQHNVLSPSLRKNAEIRVAITAPKVHTIEIEALDGVKAIDDTTGNTIALLPPQSQLSICTQNNKLSLQSCIKTSLANYWNIQQNGSSNFSGSQNIQPVIYRPQALPIKDYLNKGFVSTLSNWQTISNRLLLIPLSSSSPLITGNQQSSDSLITCNGKLYRGKILIKIGKNNPLPSDDNGLNIINILNIEDYLLSVVPSEMPSNWPEAALKAQAIAARSYAYANLGKHSQDGFDVKDNIEDQMYLGVNSETLATNVAVSTTSGLILQQDGKPICAYFHSASGGSTETSEHIWGKPLPYLKAVYDYDDESPNFNWSRKFSTEELENAVSGNCGKLLGLAVLSRGPSQRVKNLLVLGNIDSNILTGEELRNRLKLPSSNFNILAQDHQYVFIGHGYGHGLGLSQWGAKTLAQQGYNAAQILTYYYKDVTVEPLTGLSSM